MSDDSKPLCKYGSKCYQKNSDHLKKYKHLPSQPAKTFRIFDFGQKSKKRKLENDSKATNPEGDISNVDKLQKLDEEPSKIIKEKSPEPVKQSTIDSEESPESSDNSTDSNEIKTPEKKSPVKIDTSNNSPIEVKQRVSSEGLIFHEIPDDVPAFILEKFLVSMPKDFYSFWDYYSKNKKAANYLKTINLNIVGPFDVLAGKLPVKTNKSDYLLHWRHFFDPPEFQTILMSTKSEYHIGYYRDAPSESPCFIACNDGSCKIQPMAENIFGALTSYVSQKQKEFDVFSRSEIDVFLKDLKQLASDNNYPLQTNTPLMKKRQKTVVAKTFHEAGVVSPKDKSGVGYRPLIEKNDVIKKILKQLADAESESERNKARSLLQPIITMANIATDECDFGTGLELGIDLFAYGEPLLHNSIKSLLGVAYSMLNRDEFGEIIMAHLENRRKGSKLSIAYLD